MRQKLANGLYWLTGFALGNLFLNTLQRPFWKGSPVSLQEAAITCAVSLLLSLLLFSLIWRSPRLERWEIHMTFLAIDSGCLAASYLGWVSAPTWGLPPLLGHVLGFLVGAVLGAGISILEVWIIFLKRKPLPTEQHSILEA